MRRVLVALVLAVTACGPGDAAVEDRGDEALDVAEGPLLGANEGPLLGANGQDAADRGCSTTTGSPATSTCTR
jgi:hypothetical protein